MTCDFMLSSFKKIIVYIVIRRLSWESRRAMLLNDDLSPQEVRPLPAPSDTLQERYVVGTITTIVFSLDTKIETKTELKNVKKWRIYNMQNFVESRSQIDILSSEDATLLTLSEEVDEHTSQLRRAVLETVRSMRGKLHQQALDVVEGERARSRENERRLLEQIDRLQTLVDQRSVELEKEKRFSEKLLDMHKRQRLRHRSQALVQEGLRRWHAEVGHNKSCAHAHVQIVQRHNERLLKRVVHEWRAVTMRETFRAAVEKLDGDHRRKLARVDADHQALENTMKLEVLGIKESLAKEEERRVLLEERLKGAFMRGVCALNMEAMQVLRGASSAADADVSVASLLQGMNITNNSDSMNVEATSPEMLFQRQQALQAQINAMQLEQVEGTVGMSQPPSRPATAGVANHGHHGNIPHPMVRRTCPPATTSANPQANVTIELNPLYPGHRASVASALPGRGPLQRPPAGTTTGARRIR